MNNMTIQGTTEFMGKEIPNVYGGFGEGQKSVLAKTVAEIHEMELRKINELINEHLDEFEENIDIIDLMKNEKSLILAKDLGFITNNRQKNCYLLSEQGYMLLVGFMKTERAKELRKQFRREYFTMREIINSTEHLKGLALLKVAEGKTEEERVNGAVAYKNLCVEEATKPLMDKIEEDAPKVSTYERFINSAGAYTSTQVAKTFKLSSAQKLNKMLWEKHIIFKQGRNWFLYSDTNTDWFRVFVGEKDGVNYSQLRITPIGLVEIAKILKIDLQEKDLEEYV